MVDACLTVTPSQFKKSYLPIAQYRLWSETTAISVTNEWRNDWCFPSLCQTQLSDFRRQLWYMLNQLQTRLVCS